MISVIEPDELMSSDGGAQRKYTVILFHRRLKTLIRRVQ
jgi:hypothetical protein